MNVYIWSQNVLAPKINQRKKWVTKTIKKTKRLKPEINEQYLKFLPQLMQPAGIFDQKSLKRIALWYMNVFDIHPMPQSSSWGMRIKLIWTSFLSKHRSYLNAKISTNSESIWNNRVHPESYKRQLSSRIYTHVLQWLKKKNQSSYLLPFLLWLLSQQQHRYLLPGDDDV